MNFEEFKEAMKELKNKGYIGAKIYEDHMFVYIKGQREPELETMIERNVKKLWNKIEEEIIYLESSDDLMFMSTEKIKKVFNIAKNYDDAVEILNSANISYIYRARTYGRGVQKYVDLMLTNEKRDTYTPNFENKMKGVIKDSMPSNASCYIDGYHCKIKFDEGIEYEKRKNNCKELEIEEEFDKLFRKYE